MNRKGLPADFDGDAYRASYPDVAASGLDPAEHYRRFGAALGRSATGTKPVTEAKAETKTAPPPASVAAPEPTKPATKPVERLIARPRDLQLYPAGEATNRIGVDTLGWIDFNRLVKDGGLDGPLGAYALFAGLPSGEASASEIADLTHWGSLRGALVHIDNGWFPELLLLRLAVTASEGSDGEQIRFFQGEPSIAEKLRQVGGLRFTGPGPAICDLELVSPLMPILVERTNDEGRLDYSMIAFPSLLDGGLHHVELRASQPAPDPFEAALALGETLLAEALRGNEGRHVRSVSPSDGTRIDSEIARYMQEYAGQIFATEYGGDLKTGARLVIPGDGLPSLTALTLAKGNLAASAQLVGALGVIRASDRRPRFLIHYAPGDSGADAPCLEPASGRKSAAESAPFLLAVAMRKAPSIGPEDYVPCREPQQAETPFALSLILDADDEKDADLAVEQIRPATSALEVIVRKGEELRALAAKAAHPFVLTVSADAKPLSNDLLASLKRALDADESLAAAAPVSLAPARFRKQNVVQQASAGIFPANISLAGGPEMGFCEPDVRGAVGDSPYSVVALRRDYALWRKSDLTALKRPSVALKDDADMLAIGLALVSAGKRMTVLPDKAVLLGSARQPLDVIDPFGRTHSGPADWAALIDRVTWVRELH